MTETVLASLGLPALPEPLPAPCVDNHTHVDITASYSNLPIADNLALAAEVGITRFVQVGCDVASSRFAVDFAQANPQAVAAVALHPNDAARDPDLPASLAIIDELAAQPGVRAIGETGLDYYRTREATGHAIQRTSFIAHIEMAKKHQRSLMIHDRDAHADILEVLDEVGAPDRVVMHCFSGDADFARACLDRGFWLSFPGVVTYPSAQPQRDAFQITPLDRVLVETDAPFLTPVPARGRANAPYLLPHTIRFLAAARGVDLADFCAQVSANTDAAYGGSWGAPGHREDSHG